MGRLPIVDQQPDDPRARAVFDEVRSWGIDPVPNLYTTLAHSPRLLQAWCDFAWPLRWEATLPRRLRELVIMRVAQLTDAPYEWHNHWAMAVESGVTKEQLRSLAGWEESDAFNSTERVVLQFTDEITQHIAVSDPTFARLLEHFSPEEVVELTLTAAFYSCVSRVMRALDIDLDPKFDRYPPMPRPGAGGGSQN